MRKRPFIFVMLLLAALGCREDKSAPQPPAQQRWVYVTTEYYDWVRNIWDCKNWRIDVSEWKIGEDVVYLFRETGLAMDPEYGFYYPWQGEDSICYCYVNDFLWVNGKLVGGMYPTFKYIEDSLYRNVLTLGVYYIDLPERLENWPYPPGFPLTSKEIARFPKLSIIQLYIVDDLGRTSLVVDSLKKLTRDVDLYVYYVGAKDENILSLSYLPNLRYLTIWSRSLTNRGIINLVRAKSLKKLNIQVEKKRFPLWSVWVLRLGLPNCDIEVYAY